MKSRRPGETVSARRHILVVCEGETEAIYLKELATYLKISSRLLKVEVVFARHPTPNQVVDEALRRRDEARTKARSGTNLRAIPFDEVWIVLDAEDPRHNPTLSSALELANKMKLKCALSRPCFELWFLLHKKYTTRPYEDAEQLLSEWRDYLPGYRKTESCFSFLIENMGLALAEKHARTLLTYHQKLPYAPGRDIPNPSTSVVDLLATLRQNAPST